MTDLEQQAREVLAAQYEREDLTGLAEAARSGRVTPAAHQDIVVAAMLAFRAAQPGKAPEGMKAYGPDHPDYPNAPIDYAIGPVAFRRGTSGEQARVADPSLLFGTHTGGALDVLAYTPTIRALTKPRPDREAVRQKLFDALRSAFFAGRGSKPPSQYDSEAVETAWNRDIDAILSLLPAEPVQEMREGRPSIDLAYSLGFSDARGLAALFALNHVGALDGKALHDGILAISCPRTEAGWDGVEMPLTLALEQIDGEAPATEPHDGPTVGFPPARDPEQDDGNDVVHEAFREGVARGLWQAAKIARAALANIGGRDSE